MNESPNTLLEALTLLFNFLSENAVFITIIILIIGCREAISNLISRITSLSFSDGKSKVGVQAEAPSVKQSTKEENPDKNSKSTYEKITNEDIDETAGEEKDNILKMYEEFEKGEFEKANKTFKKHALNERDETKLQRDTAFFLYLKYTKEGDRSAIKKLENLVNETETESSKLKILRWLSYSLNESMQYEKEVELWREHFTNSNSEEFKHKSLVNLAQALNINEKSHEAKALLLENLSIETCEKRKSELYKVLSMIESSLDNQTLSIYCKDKSLEFDVNNTDYLFETAFAASNENINEISLSNYIKLINISKNNSAALNNLGASAQDAGLNIQAIDNYKKSAALGNTLAMSNQGYLLLDAGFIAEAEEIAQKALKLDEPHKNIYKLISAINEKKEILTKRWNELKEKSLDKQKAIRLYTEQHYLGDSTSLTGSWFVNGIHPVNLKLEEGSINIKWIEHIKDKAYDMNLTGKITGSTIEGNLIKKSNEKNINSLLGLAENYDKPFFGYLSDNENSLVFKPAKLDDKISLFFTRMKS